MNHVLAQSLTLPGGGSIQGPITSGSPLGADPTLGKIVSSALPFIFSFAGIGLLLMILGAGFTFLTSAGDPKKMEQAQSQLTNAIIGIIIIIAAYWLVQIAAQIFGLTTIGDMFK